MCLEKIDDEFLCFVRNVFKSMSFHSGKIFDLSKFKKSFELTMNNTSDIKAMITLIDDYIQCIKNYSNLDIFYRNIVRGYDESYFKRDDSLNASENEIVISITDVVLRNKDLITCFGNNVNVMNKYFKKDDSENYILEDYHTSNYSFRLEEPERNRISLDILSESEKQEIRINFCNFAVDSITDNNSKYKMSVGNNTILLFDKNISDDEMNIKNAIAEIKWEILTCFQNSSIAVIRIFKGSLNDDLSLLITIAASHLYLCREYYANLINFVQNVMIVQELGHK